MNPKKSMKPRADWCNRESVSFRRAGESAREPKSHTGKPSQLRLPRPGQQPWKEQLHALAHDFRALYAQYPGLSAHLMRTPEPQAAEHAIAEAVVGILRSAGVPDTDLSTVTRNLISFFASSFTLEHEGREKAAARFQWFWQLNADRLPSCD